MIKTYPDFLDTIKQERLSKEAYYKHLVLHKDAILLDIAKTSQTTVAKKLNITQSKLSTLLNLLVLDELCLRSEGSECY